MTVDDGDVDDGDHGDNKDDNDGDRDNRADGKWWGGVNGGRDSDVDYDGMLMEIMVIAMVVMEEA